MKKIPKYKSIKKGFTLVELVISSSLILMVVVFIGYLSLLQATQADYYYQLHRAENNARNIADIIRFNVIMARFGTISVTDAGHTITFNDPNLNSTTKGNNISRFRFDGVNLIYTIGYTSSTETKTIKTYKGIKDIIFSTTNNGSYVNVTITIEAKPYKKLAFEYGTTDSRKQTVNVVHSLTVYLRN